MDIVIIHGTLGNPRENWFPWLKNKLTKLGHNVFVPTLPTPEGQSFDNWLSAFYDQIDCKNKSPIFIAHSLGPVFVLGLLEKGQKADACFFIAPFLSKIGNDYFDNLNSSFLKTKLNEKTISRNCNNFFIYVSDNDPYVPVQESRKVADGIGSDIILKKGMGHFNSEAGVDTAEFLMKDLSDFLEKNKNNNQF